MPGLAHGELELSLREIQRHIRELRFPIGKLQKIRETQLLTNLLEGLRIAERRNVAASAALAEGRPGAAIGHCMELCDAVRDGIFSRDNCDDLDRELQGDGERSPNAQWHRLESGSEALHRACSRLAEAVIAYSPGLDLKEPVAMPYQDTNSTNELSEIGAALALLAGGGVTGSRSARRFETVADQMAATLDALGLPHDGVQLDRGTNVAAARDRLIEGLDRNFSSREQDGHRVFFRTDAQLSGRETAGSSQLLRGRCLVDANLLRAEADAVLDIIDRLPSMARFELSRQGDLRRTRDEIRQNLDAFVEISRDPMGINLPRAGFQLWRLVLAVFDYLDDAEVLDRTGDAHIDAFFGETSDTTIENLIGKFQLLLSDDELSVAISVVRSEEIGEEIKNLVALLHSMAQRIVTASQTIPLGAAAARLEELLSAALRSVDQLEFDLERSGTDLPEQDVQFETDEEPTAAGSGNGNRLSIGQFIRWVRAVALPYAGADNRAAMLRGDQAAVLQSELDTLSVAAGRFANSLRLGLSRPLPRLQLEELKGYLASARDQAETLARN